jgi:biotin carboxyl carrier protein
LQVSKLSAGLVIAPLPGVVKSILVKEGDAVKEGDVVLVLEAMKMDNEISSRSNGTVKTIHVAVGDSVQEDQLLIDIEGK